MTDTLSRQACPVCDSVLPSDVARCPNCDTDLSLVAATAEVALDLYNEGLDLAKSGDRSGAIEKMRSALAAEPTLVDAYIVLGKLLAQSGATLDMEQAVLCWRRARTVSPTEEQGRKLDQCTEIAEAHLRQARRQDEAKRRQRYVRMAGGLLAVAAVCLGAAYLLRPTAPRNILATRRSHKASSRKSVIGKPPAVAGQNAVIAVNEALQRPDITVAKLDDHLVIQGTLQTEAEKRITLAAAAYAAGVPVSAIDSTRLKVKPNYASVAAKRVEHMLRLIVDRLGSASPDPMHSAVISVSGGVNKEPLIITGTCANPGARAEAAEIIKEVYPSANPVDASGLVVTRRPMSTVQPVLLPAAIAPPAEARRLPAPTRIASSRVPTAASAGDQVYINLTSKTYTVQPGDTIFAITHKYGRDSAQWQELWQTNRATIQKPDAIPAGTVLKLPPGWKAVKQSGDDNE